jgi:hypothetical protein
MLGIEPPEAIIWFITLAWIVRTGFGTMKAHANWHELLVQVSQSKDRRRREQREILRTSLPSDIAPQEPATHGYAD